MKTYQYPEYTDMHYITKMKIKDIIFDENYPYIDNSFGFKIKRFFVKLGLKLIVFPFCRIKVGLKIEGRENDVYLYNALYTTGSEDNRTGTRRDGTTYTKGEYVAGDTIKVDTTNALRLGVLHDDGETSSIFEPSIGLGSYAIEGQTDLNYNPSKNAMFTYFNNIHEAQLRPISGNDEELVKKYKNTYKSLGEAVSFGVFEKENGKYNDIKLTVSLWLEGMDADYISGVYDRSVSMFLNF